ncbi:MAG: hypothetical protein ACFCVA_11375 [Gammaproteobacteria bacterium]
MGGSIIQIPGSQIEAIDTHEASISVRFAPALIVKSEGVPGVDASTLWKQGSVLVFQDGEIEGELTALPATLAGGKFTANCLSYVDMIPLPLDSAGSIRLVITFVDRQEQFAISGSHVRLTLLGHAQYVEHLPPA